MSGQKSEGEIFRKNRQNLYKVSLTDSEYIYDNGVEEIIIGTCHAGYVELSKRASKFFEEKNAKTKLLPTPKTIELWNKSKGKVITMFHVIC